MNISPRFTYLAGILFFLLLIVSFTGCQKTVYLMPTPAVIASGEHNPFILNPNLKESNQIRIFYATNRSSLSTNLKTNYSIFPGKHLYMGIGHLEIGNKKTDWSEIFKISTSDEQGRRPAFYLDNLEELAAIPFDNNSKSLPESSNLFIEAINSYLDKSLDKDILVYVHGANSTLYRASAQAAQYHHFTGQNSLVIAFLWPSAENLLAYGKDVRHARKSTPAFKHLISFLSEHTTAENINILTYSAGSQIVSPALESLGKETQGLERDHLRLGEVYYAAADIGIDSFIQHLQSYIDIPRSVTLSINMKDSVLALARRHHGISRVGSPNANDVTDEDADWVRGASHEHGLYIIGINDQTVKGLSARSHNFWYNHPWISSDVLVQLMLHMDPAGRGLTENINEDGFRFWTFPADYPDRIVRILDRAKEIQKK